MVRVAAASTLVLGVGTVAGGSLHALWQVRRMRDRGRLVRALEHQDLVPGRDPTRRLVVIGDSAAAGHGLEHAEQAYSHLVAAHLTARDGRATSITNVAADGATIRDVLEHQLGAVFDADVVVIGVGVNDAIRRRPPLRIQREMQILLRRVQARATPSARSLLLTAADLSSAPGLPQQLRTPLGWLCRRTARIQAQVAASLGWAVLPLPREVLPFEVFGDDGFHPGVEGHRRLAEEIARVLTAPRN